VDEAIHHLQQALWLDSRNLLALNNLALALESKGRLDGAIERYQQALDIAPSSTQLSHFTSTR
jgi:tetratricopeptide (TPR) repeat protein